MYRFDQTEPLQMGKKISRVYKKKGIEEEREADRRKVRKLKSNRRESSPSHSPLFSRRRSRSIRVFVSPCRFFNTQWYELSPFFLPSCSVFFFFRIHLISVSDAVKLLSFDNSIPK